MGCNCSGARDGYQFVWQHRDGKKVTEHDSQAKAYAARAASGNRGLVIKITKRVK